MKHPGRPVNIHRDLCLCGSGRLMRDCCLFIRCSTNPLRPATGYSHPSCFARSLNDCAKTISREHYVSRSVFDLFGGRAVVVSGTPWIPDGNTRTVSAASLTGKMLCTRHNHALSSLDAIATKFYGFATAEWTGEATEVFLIRGYDLERWLLKMLCGLVASGNATFNGSQLPDWVPPVEWLDILFGSEDVKFPSGLHLISGSYYAQQATINVTPVFKSATGNPIALAFTVEGLAFLFAMEELPPKDAPNKMDAKTNYRPKALQLRKDEQIREAHFGWPGGKLVKLRVGGAHQLPARKR